MKKNKGKLVHGDLVVRPIGPNKCIEAGEVYTSFLGRRRDIQYVVRWPDGFYSVEDSDTIKKVREN